jgi:hypothetical protein
VEVKFSSKWALVLVKEVNLAPREPPREVSLRPDFGRTQRPPLFAREHNEVFSIDPPLRGTAFVSPPVSKARIRKVRLGLSLSAEMNHGESPHSSALLKPNNKLLMT